MTLERDTNWRHGRSRSPSPWYGLSGSSAETPAEDVIARQLLKAATSIGANYREANRAESRPDFIHKTGLAEKEASETGYWLAICEEAGMGPAEECAQLAQEARELLAIVTTINRKAKGR